MPAVPFLTPAYPFDPALIDASILDAARRDLPSRDAPRPTPHIAFPAIDGTPLVLGGVLRSDSPFLDAMPYEGMFGEFGDPIMRDATMRDGGSPDGFARDEEILWPIAPGSRAEPTSPRETLAVATPELSVPPAPFDRAAVARASARAARAVERVEATVMTDDGVAEHVCDIASWLAGATLREIEALAGAEWTGDVAADVAADLVDDDPEVADVLRHASRAESAVIVEIDGGAAMAWLTRHRPSIAVAITDARDEIDEGDAG